MRNNKTAKLAVCMAAVLCSACLLSGCGKDREREELLEQSLVSADDEEIGTSTAQIGSLREELTFSGEVYYPVIREITCPESGYALKQIVVEVGDTVSSGDLIAEVEALSAEDVNAKQQQIDQKQKELEDVRAYTNQEINSLTAERNAAQTELERQICDLKIQEQQLTMAHMEEEYAKEIAGLEEEMQQIQSAETLDGIYAPYDGVIEEVNSITAGTVLTDSRPVVAMYSVETCLITAKNPGNVRYGDVVTVTAGIGDGRREYSGQIVGADNALDEGIQDGNLYIKLTEDYDPENLKNIEIVATGYEVEDVLVVKANAVFEQKDESYVYLLEDDKLMQRHVIVGGTDGEYTWILQGLSEGDVVSIQ